MRNEVPFVGLALTVCGCGFIDIMTPKLLTKRINEHGLINCKQFHS